MIMMEMFVILSRLHWERIQGAEIENVLDKWLAKSWQEKGIHMCVY